MIRQMNKLLTNDKNEDGIECNKNLRKKLYKDSHYQIPSCINGKYVTSVGAYAFKDCKGLQSIIIPNSMTRIGEGAFHGCNKLTNLVIVSNSMIRIFVWA